MEKYRDKNFHCISEYNLFDGLPIEKHQYRTHDSHAAGWSRENINKQLKYEMLLERCQCHGFSKSGKHRAYVTGCSAVHKLKVSPDGTYLYFDNKYWEWEHNHSKTYEVLQKEHRALVKGRKRMSDKEDQPPKKKLRTGQHGRHAEMFLDDRVTRDVATQTVVSNVDNDYEIVFTRVDNR